MLFLIVKTNVNFIYWIKNRIWFRIITFALLCFIKLQFECQKSFQLTVTFLWTRKAEKAWFYHLRCEVVHIWRHNSERGGVYYYVTTLSKNVTKGVRSREVSRHSWYLSWLTYIMLSLSFAILYSVCKDLEWIKLKSSLI